MVMPYSGRYGRARAGADESDRPVGVAHDVAAAGSGGVLVVVGAVHAGLPVAAGQLHAAAEMVS
jgi:hypothetical protein